MVSTPEPGFKLIRAGRLIDGVARAPIDKGAILVKGSKIVQAGPQHEVAPPEGASVETFDFPDATIMPGMVDCHTHHNGFGDGRLGDDLATLPDEVLTLQSARNARASLFTGVTTIRENGPKNATTLRLRDAIGQGITVGPRMVLCGRPLSIIGGHMDYMGSVATGADQARAEVRRLVKEGADYIKITATGGTTKTSNPLRPTFNVDELTAAADEAHKFGKLTATHCSSIQGTVNSLEAGVDMIIHCIFKDANGTHEFSEPIAERIGNQGAFINPTLHVFRSRLWVTQLKKEADGLTPEEASAFDEDRRHFDTHMEHAGRLIDMGLNVITGSDSSWGDYQLGNTVSEIECLSMAGYSPMKCVFSVTSEAAKALGVDDTVGTLEPGKEADVIVVDGNPAEDVEALWRVREVFLGGRHVERGSEESVDALRQPRPADPIV